MNTEITTLIEEIGALAQENGWQQTTGAAQSLLSAAAQADILLTAPVEVDVQPLKAWLAQTAPNRRVSFLSLPALHADPLPALQAARLVIALECGRLMDTNEVDAIAGLIPLRPEKSFAYALTCAERISNDEDLDLVQRGFWRLLVPEPKPEWNGQDIHPYNAHLWTQEATALFLEGRVRQDRQSLSDWLLAPDAGQTERAQQQAMYLFNLAEEEAQASAPAPPDQSDVDQRAVSSALDSIMELRRRFNRRMDADAASIERDLTVSLQTLEQNLLVDLIPYLRQRVEALRGDLDSQSLRAILTEYIHRGAQQWEQNTQEWLAARGREMASDAQLLFGGINWGLINAVVQRNGHPNQFPDSLLRNLANSREFQILQHSPFGSPDVAGYQAQSGFGSVLRIAAAGSIAGGVTLFLLGLGPIGIITAGAAGALGGGAIHRAYQSKISVQEAEGVSRQAIKNVLREAVSQARQQTLDTFAPLRSRFNQELKELENMLDQTLVEVRRADTEGVSDSFLLPGARIEEATGMERLRALRSRLSQASGMSFAFASSASADGVTGGASATPDLPTLQTAAAWNGEPDTSDNNLPTIAQ